MTVVVRGIRVVSSRRPKCGAQSITSPLHTSFKKGNPLPMVVVSEAVMLSGVVWLSAMKGGDEGCGSQEVVSGRTWTFALRKMLRYDLAYAISANAVPIIAPKTIVVQSEDWRIVCDTHSCRSAEE
jgi:hypothetical protein